MSDGKIFSSFVLMSEKAEFLDTSIFTFTILAISFVKNKLADTGGFLFTIPSDELSLLKLIIFFQIINYIII